MRRVLQVALLFCISLYLGSGGFVSAAPNEERFEVILTGFGDSKIGVIKVVRENTGLGLKEAKDLVEGAPKPLKTGLSKEDAAKLKAAVEAAGGTCEVKGDSTKTGKNDQAALEKAFSDKLSGATLVGSFSVDGKDGAKPDRYKIVSAKKVKDADWIITATMKVGDNNVDIPIPIKIYWADDTPVMSLTDLPIPGVGTFTSRVMFYGDRYAGTWQHGDHGGLFWGLIEKQPVAASTDKK